MYEWFNAWIGGVVTIAAEGMKVYYLVYIFIIIFFFINL